MDKKAASKPHELHFTHAGAEEAELRMELQKPRWFPAEMGSLCLQPSFNCVFIGIAEAQSP